MSLAALQWRYSEACRGVFGAGPSAMLAFMAWRCMDDGDGNEVCDLSLSELAEGTGCSRDRANAIIKECIAGGAVEVVRLGSGRRPSRYRLMLENHPAIEVHQGRRCKSVEVKIPDRKVKRSSPIIGPLHDQQQQPSGQNAGPLEDPVAVKIPDYRGGEYRTAKGGYKDEDIKTQDQDMSEPLSRSDAAGESDPPKSKSTTPEGTAANQIARLLKQDLEARGKVVTVTKSSAAIVTQNLKALIKQHGADAVADTYAKATTADLGAWPWGSGLATITSANGYDAIANGHSRRGRRGPTQVDDLPDYSSEEYTRGATLVYHMDEEDE